MAAAEWVRRLVASDVHLNSLKSFLEGCGYRVSHRFVLEKGLDGVVNEFLIIHAVSNDDRVVLIVRGFRGVYRIHVSIRDMDLDDHLDELESIGFSVDSSSESITLSGYVEARELFNKVSKLLNIIQG